MHIISTNRTQSVYTRSHKLDKNLVLMHLRTGFRIRLCELPDLEYYYQHIIKLSKVVVFILKMS